MVRRPKFVDNHINTIGKRVDRRADECMNRISIDVYSESYFSYFLFQNRVMVGKSFKLFNVVGRLK